VEGFVVINQADVIVIGSGGLGAATAFCLARRGIRNVALVDKHDIASQTSPRAAGMVSVPEPSALALLALGFVALALLNRRRTSST
jgi:glycine/D-amino acid oxidase-like deaminating enzyme